MTWLGALAAAVVALLLEFSLPAVALLLGLYVACLAGAGVLRRRRQLAESRAVVAAAVERGRAEWERRRRVQEQVTVRIVPAQRRPE